MKVEVLYLPAGGSLKKVKIDPTSLDDCYELVNGGPLESVFLTATIHLFCNEEGKILNLPYNFPYVRDGKIVDHIHGDVFFCSLDSDGEISSLDESDEKFIYQKFAR